MRFDRDDFSSRSRRAHASPAEIRLSPRVDIRTPSQIRMRATPNQRINTAAEPYGTAFNSPHCQSNAIILASKQIGLLAGYGRRKRLIFERFRHTASWTALAAEKLEIHIVHLAPGAANRALGRKLEAGEAEARHRFLRGAGVISNRSKIATSNSCVSRYASCREETSLLILTSLV